VTEIELAPRPDTGGRAEAGPRRPGARSAGAAACRGDLMLGTEPWRELAGRSGSLASGAGAGAWRTRGCRERWEWARPGRCEAMRWWCLDEELGRARASSKASGGSGAARGV
jgi:hypothetical protein